MGVCFKVGHPTVTDSPHFDQLGIYVMVSVCDQKKKTKKLLMKDENYTFLCLKGQVFGIQ